MNKIKTLALSATSVIASFLMQSCYAVNCPAPNGDTSTAWSCTDLKSGTVKMSQSKTIQVLCNDSYYPTSFTANGAHKGDSKDFSLSKIKAYAQFDVYNNQGSSNNETVKINNIECGTSTMSDANEPGYTTMEMKNFDTQGLSSSNGTLYQSTWIKIDNSNENDD